ncbi:hypothetical protein GGR25_002221 [Kaistia hirudinis]|uniref:YCII-related domain-containing protein n=1 Tax=Kaistia hirudinis TaxID=1293440 RepID=A0A840AQN2_9HYPH|nr:YciI family protein [Kaistia hirudinis]MBB3931171.1 hypothetical protein [Kaistia hirudinis]
MLFAIHALDGTEGLARRKTAQQPHSEHLKKAGDYGVRMVMAGPLVEDDGTTMKGSLLIVDADDRGAVEAFNRDDPYHAAGVWEVVTITAFQKRQG